MRCGHCTPRSVRQKRGHVQLAFAPSIYRSPPRCRAPRGPAPDPAIAAVPVPVSAAAPVAAPDPAIAAVPVPVSAAVPVAAPDPAIAAVPVSVSAAVPVAAAVPIAAAVPVAAAVPIARDTWRLFSDVALLPDDSIALAIDFIDWIELRGERHTGFDRWATLLTVMQKTTGCGPKRWGPAIIGFGTYHYRYESGREGDWFLTGFSPRKNDLTLYIMAGFDRYDSIMKRLGKYKTGKSCLYIKKLADIDRDALRELIGASVGHIRRTYPG